MNAVRSVIGTVLASAPRRLRTVPVLAVLAVLVVATPPVFGAVADRILAAAAQAAAAEAVGAAGSDADVVVTVSVGSPTLRPAPAMAFPAFAAFAADVPGRTPASIRRVATAPTALVTGPDTAATAGTGEGLVLRPVLVDQVDLDRLRLVSGRRPAAADEVLLPSGAAATAGLRPGDALRVSGEGGDLRLVVAGLVDMRGPTGTRVVRSAPALGDAERLIASGRPAGWAVGVLTPPAAASRLSAVEEAAWEGSVRTPLRPGRFDPATVVRTADAVDDLAASAEAVFETTGVSVSSRLRDLTAPALQAIAAVRTLAALPAAGVQVAAVAAAGLLAVLLTARRSEALLLERRRGIGAAATVRAVTEAALLALAGAGLALLATRVLAEAAPPLSAVLPAAAALVVALPVAEAVSGRAVPAGAAPVLDVTVVVLALAAVLAPSSPGQPLAGIELPALAVATALVVLRVGALATPPLQALAARTRGSGLVVVSLAAPGAGARAVAAVVAVAVAVAVAASLTVSDLRSGLGHAAWHRVGADARIAEPLDDDAVRRIAGAPGVTAVSRIGVERSALVEDERGSALADVLAVDGGWAGVLDGADALAAGERSRLARLGTTVDGRVPVLTDGLLDGRNGDATLRVSGTSVPIRIVGASASVPADDLRGQIVVVDRHLLERAVRGGTPPGPTFVDGPGAAGAATATAPRDAVTLRSAVLADARVAALPRGLDLLLVLAVVLATLLALLGAAAHPAASAARRARVADLLAVLGADREAPRLVIAGSVPVLLAGVAAGLAGGVLAVGGLPAVDAVAGAPGTLGVVDVLLVVAAVGGLATAVIAVAVVTQLLVARAGRPARTLRIGADQ